MELEIHARHLIHKKYRSNPLHSLSVKSSLRSLSLSLFPFLACSQHARGGRSLRDLGEPLDREKQIDRSPQNEPERRREMDILEATERASASVRGKERARETVRTHGYTCARCVRVCSQGRKREREKEREKHTQRCQKALAVFRGISAGCLETSTLSRRYRVCHDAARHPRQASEGGLEGGGRATCCVVSDATG